MSVLLRLQLDHEFRGNSEKLLLHFPTLGHQRSDLTLCFTVSSHQAFPRWLSTMTHRWQGSWHSTRYTESTGSAPWIQEEKVWAPVPSAWVHETIPGCAPHLKPRWLLCAAFSQLSSWTLSPALFQSMLKFKKLVKLVVLKEIQDLGWLIWDTWIAVAIKNRISAQSKH